MAMIQECPYAHDDPDHDNPPLLHEMGDQDQVLHKFKLSMSGMNPFMAAGFGGGMMGPGMLGNPAMAASLLNSITGKNGMSEENRQQALQAVAASTGMSAEVLRNMEPEQLQSVVQMAAMRSMQGMMGGGPEAEVMQHMMASNPEAAQSMMQMAAASGLPPAAVMQMMAAGGGGQEAVQAVMQMAAAGGVPPAALQGMMASMASGSLGEGGEYYQELSHDTFALRWGGRGQSLGAVHKTEFGSGQWGAGCRFFQRHNKGFTIHDIQSLVLKKGF